MSGAEETTTAAAPPVDLAVTTNFREAIESIRGGVLDLARGLRGAQVDDLVGEGLVHVLAGLRELEFLDEDIERMEAAFEQRRVESESERQAENDRMWRTAMDGELERRGLAIVPKAEAAAPKSARRLRRAS